MKDKGQRREMQRHKSRYGPKLTNPGLRIIQRELSAKNTIPRDVPCPVCSPIPWDRCTGCYGSGWVTPEDARLIRVVLDRH